MNRIGFEIGHPQTEHPGQRWLCFICAARKPKLTEDGSPGIDDPDWDKEPGLDYSQYEDEFD